MRKGRVSGPLCLSYNPGEITLAEFSIKEAMELYRVARKFPDSWKCPPQKEREIRVAIEQAKQHMEDIEGYLAVQGLAMRDELRAGLAATQKPVQEATAKMLAALGSKEGANFSKLAAKVEATSNSVVLLRRDAYRLLIGGLVLVVALVSMVTGLFYVALLEGNASASTGWWLMGGGLVALIIGYVVTAADDK